MTNNFSTSMLSYPSDISGSEKYFFSTILVKSSDFDLKQPGVMLYAASRLLKNRTFIHDVCESLKGFLTHNPKIFDAKVKGRVFLSEHSDISETPYIYTDSVQYHHLYDWAGNAKYISRHYFLCTEFLHNGAHTTLYHEFLKGSSELVNTLVTMGLTKGHQELIKNSCRIHRENAFPDSVPPYQVQVLIPYTFENGSTDYISASPVSASKVQAAIHSFSLSDNGRLIGRAFHYLIRPENMGALALSTGGSIGVLAPNISLQSEVTITTSSIIKQLKTKDDLFDTSGLDFSGFLKLRKKADFASNRYIPSPSSPQKAEFLDLIQKNVASMFAMLDQLRFAYQVGSLEKETIKGLCSAQISYVVEVKLSEEEMMKIWKMANAVIQKYISGTSYKHLAYHPTLTRYISERVRNHLKPLYRGNIESAKPIIQTDNNNTCDSKEENLDQTASVYIVIPKLTVIHAHADNSPYTMGLPSITALAGFVDRLCRNINSQFQIEISSKKVAWLIHSFQHVEGIKKHEPARWNGKSKKPLSDVVSRKFCNLAFDLVLECSSDYEQLSAFRHSLTECLPVKFASGIVSTVEESFLSNYVPETFHIYKSVQKLFYELQADGIPRWMVLDYSSKFIRQSDSVIDDLVATFFEHKERRLDWNQLTVSAVGFKLLENPVMRPGSRLKYHAYCEPMVGIQELRLLKDISLEKFNTLPLFWSYQSAGKTILCQA